MQNDELKNNIYIFRSSFIIPHFLLCLCDKFAKGLFERQAISQGSQAGHNHLYPMSDNLRIFRTFEGFGQADPGKLEQCLIILFVSAADREESVLGRPDIVEMQ